MFDYIDLSSSPVNEDCVQVDPKKDYLPAMREECERYKQLLIDKTKPLIQYLNEKNPGFEALVHFMIKSNPHDFGSYLEVRVYYWEGNETACKLAFFIQDNEPLLWSDEFAYTSEQFNEYCKSFDAIEVEY